MVGRAGWPVSTMFNRGLYARNREFIYAFVFFPSSVFKIGLIILGFSEKKLKIPVHLLSQMWVGGTERLSVTFINHAWLILVEFT